MRCSPVTRPIRPDLLPLADCRLLNLGRIGISWWPLRGLILRSNGCGVDSAVAPSGDPELDDPSSPRDRDQQHPEDGG